VTADVVLKAAPDHLSIPSPELENDILWHCRQALALHKVPAGVRFVSTLAPGATGKMERSRA
jgi:acyl-coenzyme A synthetase/AMP-(fatty) acid ligase